MTPETPSPLTDHAERILYLCRELRILDDATHAARQELDEIADLVVKTHPFESLPEELRTRLVEISSKIDGRELRRAAVRHELDTLAPILPTVPVRVGYGDVTATTDNPEGSPNV